MKMKWPHVGSLSESCIQYTRFESQTLILCILEVDKEEK